MADNIKTPKDVKDVLYNAFIRSNPIEVSKLMNELKANKALAVDSKIEFNPSFTTDDIITIDRGDNAAYRFMIKLNGPTASIKEADLDPTIGYNIVFTDRYEDETSDLAKWGFIVLKKKL